MNILDLADIQGNVLRAYGRYGFPKARYAFLNIRDAAAGRAFVERVRQRVTTAQRWEGDIDHSSQGTVKRPNVTLNIGFSYRGLQALDLPTRTLTRMPAEFIDGMAKRKNILGDIGPSAPEHWDTIWQDSRTDSDRSVHIWISMNATVGADGLPLPELEEQMQWLQGAIADSDGGVVLLEGHGPDKAAFQEAAVLRGIDGRPVATEHFGFVDGIGDPVFKGQFPPELEADRVVGRGKLMPDQTWQPLATGEFILGHPDESQELPPIAPPAEFMRNGTFMAYRKLHQNVGSFHDYIAEAAGTYAKVMGVPEAEAAETIRAKMVGRWSDGVPLMVAPTWQDWRDFHSRWPDIPAIEAKRSAQRTDQERQRVAEYRRILLDFRYREDIDGFKCPVSAHIRRANTRDMLDPALAPATRSDDPETWSGSALNKRRRILRRGLPYGAADPHAPSDTGEHGIIFMPVCASLFRQFEFVQQQWLHYGLDFNVGNDTCPVVGHREHKEHWANGEEGRSDAKFVIASDPASGKPSFICGSLPPFVTTRGGEYFFIPSLTALRMIAMGIVDPT